MKKTIKNPGISGVSIIEIMISLVVVAILLIAVVSAFPSLIRQRKGMQENDQARILASEVLAGLQALSAYTNDNPCLWTVKGTDFTAFESNYSDSVRIGTTKYFVRASSFKDTVGGIRCPTNGDWNTATVTVGWRDKTGKNRTTNVTGAIR